MKTAPDWTTRDAAIVAPPRRDDVIVEELEGELVFSDPRDGRAFHLNGTAYAVWNRCDGRTTTLEIAGWLTTEFEVELDQALDDVEQLVVFFVESGLTRIDPAP